MSIGTKGEMQGTHLIYFFKYSLVKSADSVRVSTKIWIFEIQPVFWNCVS